MTRRKRNAVPEPDFTIGNQKFSIVNPYEVVSVWRDEPTGHVYQFGAYGGTELVVWETSLEDGLEESASWLAENAPGLIISDEELWKDKGAVEDAMEAAGFKGRRFDDLTDEDQGRVWESLTVDLTYTESGYIPSWEWYVNEIAAGDAVYDEALKASWELYEEQEGGLTDDELETYEKQMEAIGG